MLTHEAIIFIAALPAQCMLIHVITRLYKLTYDAIIAALPAQCMLIHVMARDFTR